MQSNLVRTSMVQVHLKPCEGESDSDFQTCKKSCVQSVYDWYYFSICYSYCWLLTIFMCKQVKSRSSKLVWLFQLSFVPFVVYKFVIIFLPKFIVFLKYVYVIYLCIAYFIHSIISCTDLILFLCSWYLYLHYSFIHPSSLNYCIEIHFGVWIKVIFHSSNNFKKFI